MVRLNIKFKKININQNHFGEMGKNIKSDLIL